MQYRQSKQAYQDVAGDGATQADLTQHVYYYLAQDLLHAAEAMRRGHIEARCAACNHAFLLLGHLESWLERLQTEPALADSLCTFYAMLRVSIIQAQGALDPDALEHAARHVLDTRNAWRLQSAKPFQAPSVVGESTTIRMQLKFSA